MFYERRSRYYIDPEIQNFIMKTFVGSIVVIVIGLALLFIRMNVYMHNSSDIIQQGIHLGQMSSEAIAKEKSELLMGDVKFTFQLFMIVLFVQIWLSLLAFKFSHKIAGPIYHLKRVIKDIKKGDVSLRARIRRTDKLHGFVDEFNSLLDFYEDNYIHPKEKNKKILSIDTKKTVTGS